jgi:hypothetical protein
MGNWYTNIALKEVSPSDVLRNLSDLGRRAIVNPAQNGWVTVFDEQCDNFDLDTLESLALTLSLRLCCTALPSFNADDDILWLAIYQDGRRVSRYASSVEHFEDANEFPPVREVAADLCRIFEKPDRLNHVRRILGLGHSVLGLLRPINLRIAYVVEIERHIDLAKALGLPSASVGLGYTYVARGELAEGMQAENLLKTFGG